MSLFAARRAIVLRREGRGAAARFWVVTDGRDICGPFADADEARIEALMAQARRVLELEGMLPDLARASVDSAVESCGSLHLDRLVHAARLAGGVRSKRSNGAK